jgi:hypothetical protein
VRPHHVEAYPDVNIQFVEELEERTVQQDPVGLHDDVHPRSGGFPHRRYRVLDQLSAREQRLAAVQDDLYLFQSMLPGVLGDAERGAADRFP